MEDSKRWTVTYTKHIKQKRKVYQDGFLKLHISTSKVALYDECETLLECRLLKNDETVISGESLVFNGYLVDIGDQEGDKKPDSDLNVDRRNRSFSRFRTPSDRAKHTRVNEKENVGRMRSPLSPSQKIIREFKKRELLKYKSPEISQQAQNHGTEEWHVLYTTQVSQKAKKYHDGFLRLVLRGSCGSQIMLFDTSKKVLDSRFLKKDDVIKPGETIAFDSYLIDIGEHQGGCSPDSKAPGDKFTNFKGTKMDRQKTYLHTDTHETVGKREWQVLYTSELTKKNKKYHDGFLHIEPCGSFGKQVVLYDLSKRPLERRFLKKDEIITRGESVHLDRYFVEVGEPEGSNHSPTKLSERRNGNNVDGRGHGQNGCNNVNPSFAKGQPPSKLCPGKGSGMDCRITEREDIKSNRITPPIKPLRDADQILSILQNPNLKPRESYVTGGLSPNRGQNIGDKVSAMAAKSCQNIVDKESAAIAKSLDITLSGAACSGDSFQSTENVSLSHQSYSQKDAQTNTIEKDFGCESCLVINEEKSDEEFPCERETIPSFDLGF
ncbi:hypothetical protein PHAVU_002G300700 [Phaseolus vulgaris]|uniref:5'-3' DNA helicase ZGRF1-like N-terminal domain-containing protein n=1 Tax=Phaseolus vulgaris TaxID=3885 RepID=V7CTH2_PHAVU|nr:hypothetical protein PHAVU_002G300700g [Phaseolus vulgaris]XP_007160192.1 hypothetical protein PHAVU_002G300700g [Phaseolus vulgaris]ESW32185.1 hypothetical protein PHAVU_002G300700g [Phaseolus vulgaris]ESW32186.1 hypothetical protein PHAVU_002G300700g [Phaseolus vulgaris]